MKEEKTIFFGIGFRPLCEMGVYKITFDCPQIIAFFTYAFYCRSFSWHFEISKRDKNYCIFFTNLCFPVSESRIKDRVDNSMTLVMPYQRLNERQLVNFVYLPNLLASRFFNQSRAAGYSNQMLQEFHDSITAESYFWSSWLACNHIDQRKDFTLFILYCKKSVPQNIRESRLKTQTEANNLILYICAKASTKNPDKRETKDLLLSQVN